MQRTMYICGRSWKPGLEFWVSNIKGASGADWGYSPDRTKAIPLTITNALAFVHDSMCVGAATVFVEKAKQQ